MSKLQKFIDNNREGFDDQFPPENLWDKIEASLAPRKERKVVVTTFFKWMVAAASILAVVSVLYFQFHKETTEASFGAQADIDINRLAPEYAPQVNEFAKMIDLKQEELKQMSKEQPVLYQTFTKDITQLDSSYASLKKQLSTSANKEVLVEAMIQNLQLQLQVLNQQLNIIHEIKQSKNDYHEKKYQSI